MTEAALEMPPAFEIALLEDPGVAAFGIGEDFPGVVVGVPEKERICRVYHTAWTSHRRRVDEPGCVPLTSRSGVHDSTSPRDARNYSFLFWDADDNAWGNPLQSQRRLHLDLRAGRSRSRGHFERGFRHKRPDAKKETA